MADDTQKEPRLFTNQYADTPVAVGGYAGCDCFQAYDVWQDRFENATTDEEYDALEESPVDWSEVRLHVDEPHSSQKAWDEALEILDNAAKRGVVELNLGKEMHRENYLALHTLPDSIGDLKDLQKLVLYGSNLSTIPRAIAGCVNLRVFEPYTSYRLHWFPYEMRQCAKLKSSCISTRALYGNFKHRAPFPDLSNNPWSWPTGGARCSVCGAADRVLEQYWVSQAVASDVVPLLLSVCGEACLGRVGPTARNHVQGPHRGGLSIQQPPPI